MKWRTSVLCVSTLLVALAMEGGVVRHSWQHNAGGIVLNRALVQGGDHLPSIEWATRQLLGATEGHRSERSFLRLGQALMLSGDYEQAEMAFRAAVSFGPADVRGYLWFAETLVQQGRRTEAILSLLELLKREPTNMVAIERLEALYNQAEASHSNALLGGEEAVIGPGQSIYLALELPASRPQWLYLACTNCDGRSIQVSADGRCVEEVGVAWAAGSSARRFLLPSSVDEQVTVEIHNLSLSTATSLADAHLEYIANTEVYSDVDDATWTAAPHKAIAPSGRYETALYLSGHSPRVVAVDFYDYPDRYLHVWVDGVLVGKLTGGMQGMGRGGWTTYRFQVPDAAGELVAVALENPSTTQATAVRHLYIVAGRADE